MFDRLRRTLKPVLPQRWIDVLYAAYLQVAGFGYRRAHPEILIRPGTSDLDMFVHVFVDKEYAFDYGIVPKLIIDAGANVGYASIYFSQKFPEARIIAIEPEASNFAALQKNTSAIRDITLLQKAVWSSASHLRISGTEYGHCGFVTTEVPHGEPYDVDAVTMADVHALAGGGNIDILKMDVEGAEKAIFSGECDSWLGKVRVLVIELHDRLMPGCNDAFYGATKKYGFVESVSGEYVVLKRPE